MTWESSLRDSGEALDAEELAVVSGCVEKRRREFSASRRCARAALARLGTTGFPLLPGRDRAPIWPRGVVGSITHTDGGPDGYCAVAVARRGLTAGLGIDAEPRLSLPVELWPRVLDARELHDARSAAEPGILARLIFSAKETTYKALYPIFKQFLDFSDLHIDTQPEQGIFLARLVGRIADRYGWRHGLTGRFLVDRELIVTAMAIPPRGLPLAPEEPLPPHVPLWDRTREASHESR